MCQGPPRQRFEPPRLTPSPPLLSGVSRSKPASASNHPRLCKALLLPVAEASVASGSVFECGCLGHSRSNHGGAIGVQQAATGTTRGARRSRHTKQRQAATAARRRACAASLNHLRCSCRRLQRGRPPRHRARGERRQGRGPSGGDEMGRRVLGGLQHVPHSPPLRRVPPDPPQHRCRAATGGGLRAQHRDEVLSEILL